MKQKIIGVDVDDCLFQCVEAIFKFHNHQYHTNLKIENQLIYGLSQTFGCSEEESIDRVFQFYRSDYMKKMKPFPGALKALVQLKAKNDLLVITARPNDMREPTVSSIETHFPGIFSSIQLTNNYSKTGQKKLKSEVCKELGVSVLIDDSPINAFECAKEGIAVVLFRRPWNKSLTVQELKAKNIHSAKNWREVVKIVKVLND